MRVKFPFPSVLKWLLLADLLMVVFHLLFSHVSLFFHLDTEQTLAVIYQTSKLIASGAILFITIFSVKKLPFSSKILFPLAILLIYLGVDEGFQVHENVEPFLRQKLPALLGSIESIGYALNYSASIWLLLYIPFFFAVALYGFFVLKILWSSKHTGKYWLMAGFAAFGLVILFEVIGSSGRFSGWHYQALMILEEFSEMLGASMLATFVATLPAVKKH